MTLLLLLLVPFLVAIGSYILSAYQKDSYYEISFIEFLIILAVDCAIVIGGYYISRNSMMTDVEIQSGRVSSKHRETVPCSHSYPCHAHSCGEKDEDTCYDTCYEHICDYNWNVYSTNDEVFTIDRVDSQGEIEPERFTHVRINEPTATSHTFKNYIKGNPWSLFHRTGAIEKFKTKLPDYPRNVYDYYHVDRFVTLTAMPADEVKKWNDDVAELNAELGRKKQVNIVILVTPNQDETYYYGLEEAWLGGKKNDVIVILGMRQYPTIEWVKVMSWSRVEMLKISIRDRLQKSTDIRNHSEILNILQTEIETKFVRRHWEDFAYLLAGVKPPTWALILIASLSCMSSIGLALYFWQNDPFGNA